MKPGHAGQMKAPEGAVSSNPGAAESTLWMRFTPGRVLWIEFSGSSAGVVPIPRTTAL